MDKFWLFFASLICNFYIRIDTVSASGSCVNQCIFEKRCTFRLASNICYYVFTDQLRDWRETRTHCRNENLNMAKMHNKLLSKLNLTSLLNDTLGRHPHLNNARGSAWLGGEAIDLRRWSFLNDTTVTSSQFDIWSNFKIGPTWRPKDQCGCFTPHQHDQGNSFYLNTQACHDLGYFLCRNFDCDIASGNNCLTLVKEAKTWFQARSHCLGMGGDLFYLRDSENLSAVGLATDSSQYREISSSISNVYVGIIHRMWKWSDDPGGSNILHTNWASGEPNKFSEECLLMYGDTGEWNDNRCEDKMLTLCQGAIGRTNIIPTTKVHSTLSMSNITRPSFINHRKGGTTTSILIAVPHSQSTIALASSTTSTISYSSTTKSQCNGTTSDSISIAQDHNTKNRIIFIVVGVLLAVFFPMSIALFIHFKCRKLRGKKAETDDDADIDDVEIISNHYYDGAVDRTSLDVDDQATQSKLEGTSNYINGNTCDRPAIAKKPELSPSYDNMHLYGNDLTNSVAKNRSAIKSNPKIGPVNGDVYAMAEQARPESQISPNGNTTYMNGDYKE